MNPAEAVRRYFAAEASRDTDAVVACFAPDARLQAGPDVWHGREAIRGRYTAMAVDYPGLRVAVTDSLVEGRRAAVCWDAVLVDPHGREYPVSGVNVASVAGELIADMRSYYDPTALA